jgi:hypothetical protein
MTTRNQRARNALSAQGDRKAYHTGTIVVTLSLSARDRDRLDALAKRQGLSRSALVRQWIDRAV